MDRLSNSHSVQIFPVPVPMFTSGFNSEGSTYGPFLNIIQHSSSSESSSSEILNFNMTKLNTMINIHVIRPTLYVIGKSKLRRVTKKTIILSSLFTSLSSSMIFTQRENTVGQQM